MTNLFKAFAASAILASAGFVAIEPAFAQKAPIYLKKGETAAVGGYDTVSYFAGAAPVKGSTQFSTQYQGATFLFSSKANLDAFKAEPAKYAPQYGGYCAYAVANGQTAAGDPLAYTLHNGKLYLNLNQSISTKWKKDIPGYVAKGDSNWPRVLGATPARQTSAPASGGFGGGGS